MRNYYIELSNRVLDLVRDEVRGINIWFQQKHYHQRGNRAPYNYRIANCSVRYHNRSIKDLSYRLEITMNIHEYFEKQQYAFGKKNSYKYRYDNYLRGLGIESTNDAYYVIMCLNQIARAKKIEELIETKNVTSLPEIFGILNRTFTIPTLKPKMELPPQASKISLLAYHVFLSTDNFVYQHFPRVWNNVKDHLSEIRQVI